MSTASLIEQNRVRLKELARFGWNTPEGLPLIKTGRPVTSMLDSGNQHSPDEVVAPYRFRVSRSGNEIIILANDPAYTGDYSAGVDFLVYDVNEKASRTINVPSEARVEVVDFLLSAQGGFYLLEQLLTNEKAIVNRLRCFEPDGHLLWQTETSGMSKALLGEVKHEVFLQTESSSKTVILKIDSKTGKAEEWLSLDTIIPKIFVDDNLDLHYVIFDQQANNRVYVSYDPATGKKETRFAERDSYGLLGFPAALDARGNIYCAEGLTVSCLSAELAVKWRFTVNNVVVNSEGLFTSHFDQSLIIYRWQEDGAERIDVPVDVSGLRLAKLVGVTDSGNFVIETHSDKRALWEYKSKTLYPLPENSHISSFQLQAASTWQVDQDGNLYLPVSSAQGLHLIKASSSQS